jgi:glycosyltransferase involved in cell wall biosynthesis
MSDRLRICLVASSRFPVREPFAGGLEALTHQLASELVRRGHDVTLFAAPGSDPALPVRHLSVEEFAASPAARRDVGSPPALWMAEHHAYLALMLDLSRDRGRTWDIVHNNSLHHLPVAMAAALSVPLVTTLHTPPLPWLESAAKLSAGVGHFTAVSDCTSRAWAHAVASTTVLNGVDTDRWVAGPGGGPAIWTGRLVPEKAPHEAIAAARLAGVPLDVAGPLSDPAYFERMVAPHLGGDVRYLGHLSRDELVPVVGAARVALVTPSWEEPYGLVAAESLACGTPVAGYARGALPELVDASSGCLGPPGDVPDLARNMLRAVTLDRTLVRDGAVRRLSADRMVDEYEHVYRAALWSGAAA